tara:strand:+ start:247 stop:771 length:525 start_codon:yes stop_codon:yes gene_type:complete
MDGVKLKKLISKKELQDKVSEFADLINKTFKNEEIIVIGVMNGAFYFLHDLLKKIKVNFSYDTLSCSSYYGTLSSNNAPKVLYSNKINIENKNVLIVEDIIDTGNSIKLIYDTLLTYQPKEIYIGSIFLREKNNINHKLLWTGFTLKKEFIVGYGLDYNEKFRNLEDIYDLELS